MSEGQCQHSNVTESINVGTVRVRAMPVEKISRSTMALSLAPLVKS